MLQFNRLDDDLPTKRLLFREITKGFDKKQQPFSKYSVTDSGIRNTFRGRQAQEEEEGGTSPNSRFANIISNVGRKRKLVALKMKSVMKTTLYYLKMMATAL